MPSLGAFIILLVLISSLPLAVHCQADSTDTEIVKDENIILLTDSSEVSVIDTIIPVRNHSPRIALISSAIVPGLGQAYNRKYWKLPIIYGAGIGLYYYYNYNNGYYQRFNKAFKQSRSGQEVTDPDLQIFNQTQLETRKNTSRKYRDYSMVFMGVLYLANIIDAMVDAYMYKYDVSRDLSMELTPMLVPVTPDYTAATCGLSLTYKF